MMFQAMSDEDYDISATLTNQGEHLLKLCSAPNSSASSRHQCAQLAHSSTAPHVAGKRVGGHY